MRRGSDEADDEAATPWRMMWQVIREKQGRATSRRRASAGEAPAPGKKMNARRRRRAVPGSVARRKMTGWRLLARRNSGEAKGGAARQQAFSGLLKFCSRLQRGSQRLSDTREGRRLRERRGCSPRTSGKWWQAGGSRRATGRSGGQQRWSGWNSAGAEFWMQNLLGGWTAGCTCWLGPTGRRSGSPTKGREVAGGPAAEGNSGGTAGIFLQEGGATNLQCRF